MCYAINRFIINVWFGDFYFFVGYYFLRRLVVGTIESSYNGRWNKTNAYIYERIILVVFAYMFVLLVQTVISWSPYERLTAEWPCHCGLGIVSSRLELETLSFYVFLSTDHKVTSDVIRVIQLLLRGNHFFCYYYMYFLARHGSNYLSSSLCPGTWVIQLLFGPSIQGIWRTNRTG